MDIERKFEIIRNYAKDIVNCISASDYENMVKIFTDIGSWDLDLISEVFEKYKEDNNYKKIDCYGYELKNKPKYFNAIYKQDAFFVINDTNEKEISYDYELSSDGELIDLRLLLTFIFNDDNIEVIFEPGLGVWIRVMEGWYLTYETAGKFYN